MEVENENRAREFTDAVVTFLKVIFDLPANAFAKSLQIGRAGQQTNGVPRLVKRRLPAAGSCSFRVRFADPTPFYGAGK